MEKAKNKTIFNTAMLYLMTIAKFVFPLITLPYLTRVLSSDYYGMVSYVRATLSYVQLFIDFGFILSGVKDIIKVKGDNKEIGLIAGHIFVAKIILVVISLVFVGGMILFIPLLRTNIIFVFLSFVGIALSAFLADFLFRGIEKMHIITIIFVAMKIISTGLTFVLIKSDVDILYLPILEIISTIVALALTYVFIIKLNIAIKFKTIKRSWLMLKDSFKYFISNMATTAFGALNTVLIGIFIVDLTQIAYWSISLQLISAVQNLYTPIVNGIYPEMIKTKNLQMIHKVMAVFMPIVLFGSIISFVFSGQIMGIIFGTQYIPAKTIFNVLIPVLLFSFPAMLYGWPTLGSIGKIKETSMTTIISAILQIIGLIMLALFGQFNLINIAALRVGTEFVLMASRMVLTYRHISEFKAV